MNQGWECPKCGRVYAPFVGQCQFCPPKVESSSNYTLDQLSAARPFTCLHEYGAPTSAGRQCKKCGFQEPTPTGWVKIPGGLL